MDASVSISIETGSHGITASMTSVDRTSVFKMTLICIYSPIRLQLLTDCVCTEVVLFLKLRIVYLIRLGVCTVHSDVTTSEAPREKHYLHVHVGASSLRKKGAHKACQNDTKHINLKKNNYTLLLLK